MHTNYHEFARAMLQRRKDSSNAIAGCTYIGQMISHDIVPPTSKANRPARKSLSWALNLNSIYDDLSSNTTLFDYTTVSSTNSGAKGYDFIRSNKANPKQHVANISEKRNDENSIISQLHVFWQRLHNKLVNKYEVEAATAQKWVTLAFQLVVVHDFLYQIMPKIVFEYYFVHNKTYLNPRVLETGGHVPEFFSHASFRFGHSMIRPAYDLGIHNHSAKFNSLFNRHKVLNPTHAIDWETFFYKQKSKPIDTFITKSMGEVPRDPDTTPPHIVPMLNLESSKSLNAICWIDKIMTQDMEDDLGLTILDSSALKKASFRANVSDISELSLWPYLLLEAEIQEKGLRLGTLGSILNAEVLKIAMQRATHSIYSKKTKNQYSLSYALSELGVFGEHIKNCLVAKDQEIDVSQNFCGENKIEMMKILIDFNKQGNRYDD